MSTLVLVVTAIVVNAIGFAAGRFSRRDEYARGKRDGDHEGFMRGVEEVRRAICGLDLRRP